MAVTAEGTTTSASANYVSSLTFSKTVGSGTDRLIRVGVAVRNVPLVTGITYNAVSLTEAGPEANLSDALYAYLYTLVAPSSGANNVVVTMAGASDSIIAGASSFEGVHQTTPTSGYAIASGNSTTPSVDIASATGDMVVDSLCSAGVGGVPSVGASQTSEWTLYDGAEDRHGSGSREAGAASVTMSWTITDTSWAIIGVNLQASAEATAALTGTVTGSITEADIVAGGKTIILTLTGDTFIPN